MVSPMSASTAARTPSAALTRNGPETPTDTSVAPRRKAPGAAAAVLGIDHRVVPVSSAGVAGTPDRAK